MLFCVVLVDNEHALKSSRDKPIRVPDSNVTFRFVNWQHLIYMTIRAIYCLLGTDDLI